MKELEMFWIYWVSLVVFYFSKLLEEEAIKLLQFWVIFFIFWICLSSRWRKKRWILEMIVSEQLRKPMTFTRLSIWYQIGGCGSTSGTFPCPFSERAFDDMYMKIKKKVMVRPMTALNTMIVCKMALLPFSKAKMATMLRVIARIDWQ